ncbi:hypothetical protein P7K49_032142, partial [Saguinus oedipus]
PSGSISKNRDVQGELGLSDATRETCFGQKVVINSTQEKTSEVRKEIHTTEFAALNLLVTFA